MTRPWPCVLAASLIESGEFDPMDQMQRYVRWWYDGYLSSNGHCFDIGLTVSDSLERFEDTGDPYSGSTDAMSAGNGSLMRLAPVAMYYAGDASDAIDRSADSSRTTHGAKEAVDACRYFGRPAGWRVERSRQRHASLLSIFPSGRSLGKEPIG